MSIFSRLSDIINSNINALLDKAEDPEKMVRLIIQEMEEALVEVRSTSARAIAERKELERRCEWHESEANEWERKAEVAVRKGRDDLAKGALVERNKSTEAVGTISKELTLLDDTLEKLSSDVGALQAKIKDAKARQNAIIVRGQAAKSRLGVRRQLSEHNVDDAMQRFELYERKMDDLEGEIEAYDMGQKTLSDEIGELDSDEDIDGELDELKVRMSASEDEQGRNEATH
ncbi:MAG: phage shock protein PspA [Pseudomonadales bacterium]|jgi:phage shock protein A|nr:phage shock protein PspA [Pseudomonadales bacterium]MDP6471735.1 phage shock protein PspA [Pseudomonadales bacterium]MDP6971433.1 phage shock protein PspA [Pseudomonadales bacterium]|tara:strand:+ start:2594 stop:3286 length:693 start_codon:yes stop_codon:yes gene_type:complete